METKKFSSKYVYQGNKELFDKDIDKLKTNISKKDWLFKRNKNHYYFYQSTSTRGYLKVDVKLSISELSKDELTIELTPCISGGVLFVIGLLIPVNFLLIFINTQNENFNSIKYFYPVGAAMLVIVYFVILFNFYNAIKEIIIKALKLKAVK